MPHVQPLRIFVGMVPKHLQRADVGRNRQIIRKQSVVDDTIRQCHDQCQKKEGDHLYQFTGTDLLAVMRLELELGIG
jgi:hypothetical protein